jgi:dienelactone hydrolase
MHVVAASDVKGVIGPMGASASFIVEHMIQTRAFEKQLFAAYVNHCGDDDLFQYAGRSCVAESDGQLLATANGAMLPYWLSTSIQPRLINRARKTPIWKTCAQDEGKNLACPIPHPWSSEMNEPSGAAGLAHAFEIGDHSLELVSRDIATRNELTHETLRFRTGESETVRGILVRPRGDHPVPAILYIHAHGARYDIGVDELVNGRNALQSPLGPVFADMGIAVLAVEAPAFGTRAEPNESSRAKALLWRGKSLAGQMLGEQAAAFAWLASRLDIDSSRIGIFGLSMGATLGYWLAAVEPRAACVAHECCYADFAALIESSAHDLHGIYLTIPDLLNDWSNGDIAGLIAPRPQFIGIGDRDPLTPPEAVDVALGQTRAAYRAAGAEDKLVLHREPDTGHVETAAMRSAMLAFFRRYLVD